MILTIEMPPTCKNEKQYIVYVLVSEFLGLDYELIFSDIDCVVVGGDTLKKIVLPDIFFSVAHDKWLSKECLPKLPLKNVKTGNLGSKTNILKDTIPSIFGDEYSDTFIAGDSNEQLKISVDIFGSCFFMLSRIEEAIVDQVDSHGRFSAKNSIAFKAGFLDRPIVNEYLEYLWVCMKQLWPNLKRKQKSFVSSPTHDVDRPFRYRYKSLYKILLNVAGDIVLRRQPKKGVSKTLQWLAIKHGALNKDPFYTFEKLMNLSENHGLQSTFYFMTNKGSSSYDGVYCIHDKVIVDLLTKINSRGHQIGLHGTYNSFNNYMMLENEKQALVSTCEAKGINLIKVRSRQHYLRWKTPETFSLLNEAGIHSDSTMGFADYAGFRCGTCYNYPVYDVRARSKLDLHEYPLIMMECSILDECYMGLSNRSDAMDYMIDLKNKCRHFNGEFIYLWHNTRVVDPEEYEMLCALTSA